MDAPTPDNDPIMQELFNALGVWCEKNALKFEEEVYYLSHLLAGRIGVGKSMAAIKAMPPLYPDPDLPEE